MLIWLNGKLISRESATICAFDAGLQHGVGLFETFTARHGTVFRAEAHTRRLAESARALLLTDSLRPTPLADAVQLLVERNGLESARVRLTVTGGNLNVLAQPARRTVDPTILIDAQPPTVYPETFFEHGVMATIAQGRENPLSLMAGHKTLNYWPRIHALQHAAAKKGGETLWFTVSNHLVGGSVSNVFLVKDGDLMTPIARGEEPSTPSAVLPGITRAAILEIAGELGLETTKSMLNIDDLLGADEVFLTNSSWGVLPVAAVEREKIGGGQVGETTRRLREALLDLMERETTAAGTTDGE